MRRKAKGFTLLELIITLSLTVVILGVVYTFFLSNSKTLSKTEINSDLQMDSEVIQKELLKYGTEAEKIVILNEKQITDTDKYDYDQITSTDEKIKGSETNGKIEVSKVVLKLDNGYYAFLYEEDSEQLYINKVNEHGEEIGDTNLNLPKVLSTNVVEFKIRPLDYRTNQQGNFRDTKALEISLVLNKKKGYSDVSMPVSVIVKFRNK